MFFFISRAEASSWGRKVRVGAVSWTPVRKTNAADNDAGNDVGRRRDAVWPRRRSTPAIKEMRDLLFCSPASVVCCCGCLLPTAALILSSTLLSLFINKSDLFLLLTADEHDRSCLHVSFHLCSSLLSFEMVLSSFLSFLLSCPVLSSFH